MNNEDNVLIRSNEPGTSPALYPLDWETTEIRLGKGRFTHELRRPTTEELIAREDELQQDIPIGKDGSYSLPDPTATAEADAKLYDKILVGSTGYETVELSKLHKSNAVLALFKREIEIAEDADPLADEIAIVEEIGSGAEPEFVITHTLRQPKPSELESYRRKIAGAATIKRGKRGKQIYSERSVIRQMIAFYEAWIVRIDGATLKNGVPDQLALIAHVSPIVKRGVVKKLVEEIDEALSD